jgi:hypothetical protein
MVEAVSVFCVFDADAGPVLKPEKAVRGVRQSGRGMQRACVMIVG